MQNKTKLIIILTICILLPSFSLAELPKTGGPPQSFDEMKIMGFKALKFFPDTLKKIWQEGTIWIKKIWNSYLYPFFHKIWERIDSLFGKEIEQRKPVIKEEFKKETQEMKQDLPQLAKSVWQKLKDFFKFK